MKKAFFFVTFLVLLVASFVSCNAPSGKGEKATTETSKDSIPNSEKGVFKFTEETWDFGKIKSGEIVSHVYTFTNTGKSSIIISSVTASCGCTAPKWSKEPIKPGDKGEVDVRFDSQGKMGKLTKTVRVFSNALEDSKELKFTVEVSN